MKKAGDKAADIITGKKREISMVADDQNWRSYVANELKGAETWNQDWGFLVAKGKLCSCSHDRLITVIL